jgi:hypothetical protein
MHLGLLLHGNHPAAVRLEPGLLDLGERGPDDVGRGVERQQVVADADRPHRHPLGHGDRLPEVVVQDHVGGQADGEGPAALARCIGLGNGGGAGAGGRAGQRERADAARLEELPSRVCPAVHGHPHTSSGMTKGGR